jgi:hypothetical protein
MKKKAARGFSKSFIYLSIDFLPVSSPLLPSQSKQGAAIYTYSGTVNISICSFHLNSGSQGSAINITGTAISISICTFTSNTATVGIKAKQMQFLLH